MEIQQNYDQVTMAVSFTALRSNKPPNLVRLHNALLLQKAQAIQRIHPLTIFRADNLTALASDYS